jgi:Domain of unknown function (DUF1929)
VLLPLLPGEDYQPRILICGGRQAFILEFDPIGLEFDPTGETTSVVGRWRETARRALISTHHSAPPERRNLNTVLLPTGRVFVCGGVEGHLDEPGVFERHNELAVNEAELYDSELDEWSVLESASVVRNYHSVALLMPDGRVGTASSNKDCKPGVNELRIEVYEPDYYARSDRPVVTQAVVQLTHFWDLDCIRISTPQASTIERVAMIRIGSVTHGFNSDQRYVGLSSYESDGEVVAALPPSAIAIPGYYLLFVIDVNGIPSIGQFVQIPFRWTPQLPRPAAGPVDERMPESRSPTPYPGNQTNTSES